jgi:endonuclease/exonuclease/phosphatase family metal-dependent hydrolase
MKLFGKTLLSLSCLGGIFTAILTITADPARGDAGYRDPALGPEVINSKTLDLMTLNVAHGRGTALNQMLVSASQHRQNLGEIAAILRDSGTHIAALQEADAPSLWSGKFNHVDYLAEASDYPFSVHGYHADSWPYTYGAALLSRFKLSHTESHRFSPSWPTATKGFVRASILWRNGDTASKESVTLVSVHLDFSRENVREAQIREMINDLEGLDTPLIIMGDFNADWAVDDSPVRVLARALDLQVFRPATQDLGTYKGSERLDWILISEELRFVEYAVLPDIVSDHLAVVARIGWETEG